MDNAALIGGIVGGVVALLLIGGLIAFLVARSRRRGGNGEPNNKGASLQPVRPSDVMRDTGVASQQSVYEALALNPPESNYGVINPPQNYANWATTQDNFAKPAPNRTEYEDFTQVH
jgi:hypothetical protein